MEHKERYKKDYKVTNCKTLSNQKHKAFDSSTPSFSILLKSKKISYDMKSILYCKYGSLKAYTVNNYRYKTREANANTGKIPTTWKSFSPWKRISVNWEKYVPTLSSHNFIRILLRINNYYVIYSFPCHPKNRYLQLSP